MSCRLTRRLAGWNGGSGATQAPRHAPGPLSVYPKSSLTRRAKHWQNGIIEKSLVQPARSDLRRALCIGMQSLICEHHQLIIWDFGMGFALCCRPAKSRRANPQTLDQGNIFLVCRGDAENTN